MKKPLILGIDFNNVFMSSVFNENETNSKGVVTSGVKTFFYRLKYFKETFNPDYFCIANDLSRELTFRRKIYKPYKSHRKPRDPSIIEQMEITTQLLNLAGYKLLNNPVFEADDILGMVSKYATEQDMNMIIISADKDLYQLINDNVVIFSHKGKELIDSNWVHNNYRININQWIDFKILQGDKSDNIPGFEGIGEVTALRLLQKYGNIENIYNHLNALKPAVRDSLKFGSCRIPLVKELVTIVTDYNSIEFNLSMLEQHEPFMQEVSELLNELELHQLYDVMKQLTTL